MPTHSDAELLWTIVRALGGCNDSVRILTDECREPLLKLIRKKLPQRSPLRKQFGSDDFLQMVYMAAFTGDLGNKAFQSPQGFLRYLKVIAENALRDTIRKHLLSQRSCFGHEISLDVVLAKGEPASEDRDERDQATKEMHRRLAISVAKLPLAYRTVAKYWLDGDTPAEIAIRIKVDVGLVYRSLESAKRRVRGDWQEE